MTLFLADMEGMTEEDVKEHIISQYSGTYDWREPSSTVDADALRKKLAKRNLLIAYESVGDYGCDSSSFFLFQHISKPKYQIITGSCCSCYGFEGQGEFETVDVEYLKSDKFYIGLGGYDDDGEVNLQKMKDFIKESL